MKLFIQLFCYFTITIGFSQITFAPPQQNPFLLNDNGEGQSAPFFTDLTNNGTLNIITGTSNGELAYFINVGNSTAPLYPSQQLNYANLNVLVDFSAPVAVDLDNDGDIDILAGDSTGNFYYESNIGSNTIPNFGLAPQVNPFGLFDIGGYTNPTIADLDNDGDFDLLTGTQNGNYIYFENTGSVSNPAFSQQGTNPFGLTGIGNNGFTAPEFVDIDGDGDFDVISGSNGGDFRFYENIGSATAPSFASAILNPFGLTNVGFLSSATFGDLDGDGDLDMLAGENAGNYYYFENTSPLCTVNIPDTTFKNLLLANTAINTNGDQEIQCFEAQSYTGSISASNTSITNITGIETFTNATQINITNTAITNADLSNNTAASIVILNDNASLASLNLGTNSNLINLSVNQTGLSALNISGVVNLTDLQIAGTSFTTIDVSSNVNLEGLLLNNSAITTIDVSANILLNSFTALNSSLTAVDLSNNTQLGTFRVFGSQNLSSADLRNGTNTTTLNPNDFDARNTPLLTCISVDDVAYANSNFNLIDAGDVFSIDCNAPVNQAPTAVCQNITILLDSTGIATITTGDIDNGSTDGDGNIASLQLSQTAFNCGDVGANNVTLTVTDNEGATATCVATVIVVDAVAPTINIPPVLTFTADPGSCNTNPGFLLGASDACGIATVTSNAPAGGIYPVGNTNVTVTATDTNGNTASQTFTVTVQDTELPSIGTPANVTVDNDPGVCTAFVPFIFLNSDNCGVASSTTNAPAGDIYPIGTTTVTITVTDVNGNIANDTFTVTVNDAEAPVLTVPSAMVVDNDPGVCGATVPFIATATDNCGAPTVTSDAPAGNVFPIGNTVVTFTATDASGNTTTLTATVTVNDTEAPVLAMLNNIIVASDTGMCSAIITDQATATDNCNVTITSNAPAGFEFPVGVTTVQVTATDDNGNTDTGSYTVTVTDNEVPLVNCPSPQTVSINQGDTYIVPDYVLSGDAVISDNCTINTIVQNPAPGTTVTTGTYTIEIEAIDAAGNIANCNFDLIVDEILATQDASVLNVTLYPNPAQNFITIESEQPISLVTIYSVTGKKVMTTLTNHIEIAQLASGLYIAKLQTDNGQSSMVKFIKK